MELLPNTDLKSTADNHRQSDPTSIDRIAASKETLATPANVNILWSFTILVGWLTRLERHSIDLSGTLSRHRGLVFSSSCRRALTVHSAGKLLV